MFRFISFSEGDPGGLCKNLCGGKWSYSTIKNLGGFLPQHKRWTERVLNEPSGISLAFLMLKGLEAEKGALPQFK